MAFWRILEGVVVVSPDLTVEVEELLEVGRLWKIGWTEAERLDSLLEVVSGASYGGLRAIGFRTVVVMTLWLVAWALKHLPLILVEVLAQYRGVI